jgi:2-amino-4-hydroxy-6-hydroxymethyldihydropteridine diphosphokinase
MIRAFLGIGSNLGDRVGVLREAVRRLDVPGEIRLVETSRLYEAEPWESEPGQLPDRSEWYLNCVVAVETSLSPRALLERVQAIEAALGRTRDASLTPEARRFLPRPLDIDILLYGSEVISVSDDLHIPHLLLHERAFVLRPLADLAPELEHPTLYRAIRELALELTDTHEVRVADLPPEWFEPPP